MNDNGSALYCICKSEYREDEFMIECDKCKDWFHGRYIHTHFIPFSLLIIYLAAFLFVSELCFSLAKFVLNFFEITKSKKRGVKNIKWFFEGVLVLMNVNLNISMYIIVHRVSNNMDH